MKQSFILVSAAVILTLFAAFYIYPKVDQPPILVVLSMDGFRWDYLERAQTPHLDEIARQGVMAERFIPSFPTTTFANHYTMATGLRPGNHGIVANSFYDPETSRYYNKRGNRASVEDGSFYGGEPIWVTAEKQGIKTATYFWVGSEADVKGIRPHYWKRYQHDLPFTNRLDTVLMWLQLPENQRPQLIMWYMDEPDTKGHFYGPQNDSLIAVVEYLDSLVGVFHSKLKLLPHYHNINFIIVSDHGMAQLDSERRIVLDHYVDTSLIAGYDGGNAVINFRIKQGKLDDFIKQLSQVPHIQYWRRGEAPARLETGNHPRLHDLTVLADNGYLIEWSFRPIKLRGAHGYDNANPDMHGIFLAQGPAFRDDGYVKKPFHNIHFYPLMAEILKLKPLQVDGSRDSIIDLLKIQ